MQSRINFGPVVSTRPVNRGICFKRIDFVVHLSPHLNINIFINREVSATGSA